MPKKAVATLKDPSRCDGGGRTLVSRQAPLVILHSPKLGAQAARPAQRMGSLLVPATTLQLAPKLLGHVPKLSSISASPHPFNNHHNRPMGKIYVPDPKQESYH